MEEAKPFESKEEKLKRLKEKLKKEREALEKMPHDPRGHLAPDAYERGMRNLTVESLERDIEKLSKD